jgi:hypothetical protein
MPEEQAVPKRRSPGSRLLIQFGGAPMVLPFIKQPSDGTL